MSDSLRHPGTYPTYVGLGAAKAGTTLLHRWLEEHPQVCVPKALKEVNFFDKYYDRGLPWYRGQFEPRRGQAVGEFSVTYLESDLAQARIARDLPQAKCLVSLRDPVTRLDSEYRDSIKLSGYRWDRRAFVAARPEALERGRYGRHLARLFERFPRERVKVFIFEELIESPDRAAGELYEFLGVDASYRPTSLRERVNPSRGARWPWLDRVAHSTYLLVRERDLHWAGRIGRSGAIRRLRALNAKAESDFPPPMSTTLARELRDAYADDARTASLLIDRSLLGLWWPGGDPIARNDRI